MKRSTFRKVGLGSCIFLTFMSGVPIGVPSAHAQSILDILTGNSSSTSSTSSNSTANTTTTPSAVTSTSSQTTGTDFYTNLATTGLNGILSGTSSIQSTATQLAANAAAGSGVTSTGLQSIITGLMGNTNVNPQTAVGLIGGVLSGNISSALASTLSSIPGLGNITSVAGIVSAIPGLSSVISSLTGSASSILTQTNALTTALSALTGGNINAASLLSSTGVVAAVTAAFPQVAAALGTTGITQALGAAGSAVAGAAALGNVAAAIASGNPAQAAAAVVAALTGGTVSVSGGGLKGCAGQGCCSACADIPKHYQDVRDHVDAEFAKHQTWFLTTYWMDNILPALMMMAEQLTVAGIHQIEIIGTLLDAKHQLETQRLFQELTAQAHKDYQPSEGMCTFGTQVRSLAASQRKSDAAQLAYAQRMNQRQTMSGDVLSKESTSSDIRSRLQKFISTYCDQADNGNGLTKLCPAAVPKAARRNIDVDYTRNIESRLTLDIDYTPTAGTDTNTEDSQDVFALSANLYSHNIAQRVQPELLGDGQGKVRMTGAEKYMDLRAIYAKRSVAQNSFAALIAMRTSGDAGSAPYTKALIKELGVDNQDDIEKLLGKNPSYFAQMEVLTKKLYQNPVFYTELYDKPANVDRKGAALQAIGLMQDRDLYNSLLRSEAVLSVLLETMLQKEQEKVTNAQKSMGRSGGSK